MQSVGAVNLKQGQDYEDLHKGQHGGGAPLVGASLDYSGQLDSSLREAARVGPLDDAFGAIQGMKDQAGGARRRRKASRRGRKASRKTSRRNRKASRKTSRRNRKASRKGRKASRRMRGGAQIVMPAATSDSGTLLPPGLESKAVSTMHPEWKLAEDPTAFAPKA